MTPNYEELYHGLVSLLYEEELRRLEGRIPDSVAGKDLATALKAELAGREAWTRETENAIRRSKAELE